MHLWDKHQHIRALGTQMGHARFKSKSPRSTIKVYALLLYSICLYTLTRHVHSGLMVQTQSNPKDINPFSETDLKAPKEVPPLTVMSLSVSTLGCITVDNLILI